jgi:hypothetical protein
LFVGQGFFVKDGNGRVALDGDLMKCKKLIKGFFFIYVNDLSTLS